jgi:antitoxin HigA-1
MNLPTYRPPTHPGEMLLEEFIKPLGITQVKLAERLGISRIRLSEIVREQRGVTPDTALRLEKVLGMSADFWLGLQMKWDLYQALQVSEGLNRLKPLVKF